LAPTSNNGLGLIREALVNSATEEAIDLLFSHSYSQVDDEVRAQFVKLLAMSNIHTSSENLVLTSGAQHALSIIIAGLSEPGDIILTEQLSYPGIQATASRLHRRQVIGIEMDDQGIIPEQLELVCARYKPRFLLTVPNLHNPTGITVPESRREEIVAVARKYDLIIIEDDVYCHLTETPPKAYVSMAPDMTCYVSSMTKSIASGLRTGTIVAPEEYVRRLSATLQSSIWMIAPLMARVNSHLIESGQLPKIFKEERIEIAKRQNLARDIFKDFICSANLEAPYLWLTLPESWTSVEFTEAAQSLDIGVLPSWIFAINKDIAPEAVRITLTGISDINILKQTLESLAELLQ
jgi:DNA-binding transcriptional MocR family regulator